MINMYIYIHTYISIHILCVSNAHKIPSIEGRICLQNMLFVVWILQKVQSWNIACRSTGRFPLQVHGDQVDFQLLVNGGDFAGSNITSLAMHHPLMQIQMHLYTPIKQSAIVSVTATLQTLLLAATWDWNVRSTQEKCISFQLGSLKYVCHFTKTIQSLGETSLFRSFQPLDPLK